MHRIAGGGKEWYLIRRLKCSSDKCGRLHNELPDCLCPYKHYDAGLIEDVVDGVVSEEDTETEDYPCEGTMKHWRWWFQRNKKNMEGQIREAAHRFLDLDGKFLKSRTSLLEGLRERISPGWLKAAARAIYNSGGADRAVSGRGMRMHPLLFAVIFIPVYDGIRKGDHTLWRKKK